MKELIKCRSLYAVKGSQWLENTLMPEGVSQLTLFNDDVLALQINDLQRLLQNLNHEINLCLFNHSSHYHWTLYAEYSILKQLQIQINRENFDFLLWPEKTVQAPKLMLFDMDSTFIEIEVIDELARYHQVADKVSALTESAMRGELDFAQSLISRVSCLQGLSVVAIEEIAVKLPLSAGVTKLVTAGKTNHCVTAIVSGGFSPFVEKLKQSLDLYQVKANHLEIIAGELSGKVIEPIVDAKAKAVFLQQLCQQLNILPEQVLAIGDGANDLLMMQAAGFNLAYKAKPKVQQQARGRINATTLDRLVDIFGW